MTAYEILKHRLNLSDEELKYYISLAEMRVRNYLNLDSTADLSDYAIQIADIATLYYQKDTSNQNAQSSLGYESVSFSEGGVSESHKTMTGAKVNGTYDTAILDVLYSLDNLKGTVMFL